MSLQLAAQHLASRGRGPDTTLVHMAPQEVAGLQALAKAHGGSLTVNPDTGLAEAGFLSSILPMVAGAFLGPAGLGLTAMQAGLAGAALGTVATGSLQKGLMAGLGAYGGAGLAGGLMNAGTGAISAAVTPVAEAVTPLTATEGLTGAALESAPGQAVVGQSGSVTSALDPSRWGSADLVPTTGAPNTAQLASGVPQVQTATQAPALSQAAADTGNAYALEQAQQNAVAKELATKTPWETAKAGFGEVVKDPKRFMTKENLQYGLAGLAPVAADMMAPKTTAPRAAEKPYMYSYEPGRAADPQAGYTGAYTGERTYFNPVYTRTAAGGGLMDIGPIESMSRNNEAEVMMANGGTRFAEGGDTTKAVKPVEENPYYTMTGQSGDAFKYLMGQGPKPAVATAPVAAAPTQTTVPAVPTASSGSVRPYTFDPVTGTFTAMPVIEPAATYGEAGGLGDFASDGLRGANGGIMSLAQGGESHLGDYSDGGRLLRGPGDGVSDDIPATIGDKRPARLADGEFVVPARIVSELGNGSTEAGARKLYAMMDRVQKARSKTVGKDRVATDTKAARLLPV